MREPIKDRARLSLMQTARRMKKDGIAVKQISRYTGLTVEEIEFV